MNAHSLAWSSGPTLSVYLQMQEKISRLDRLLQIHDGLIMISRGRDPSIIGERSRRPAQSPVRLLPEQNLQSTSQLGPTLTSHSNPQNNESNIDHTSQSSKPLITVQLPANTQDKDLSGSQQAKEREHPVALSEREKPVNQEQKTQIPKATPVIDLRSSPSPVFKPIVTAKQDSKPTQSPVSMQQPTQQSIPRSNAPTLIPSAKLVGTGSVTNRQISPPIQSTTGRLGQPQVFPFPTFVPQPVVKKEDTRAANLAKKAHPVDSSRKVTNAAGLMAQKSKPATTETQISKAADGENTAKASSANINAPPELPVATQVPAEESQIIKELTLVASDSLPGLEEHNLHSKGIAKLSTLPASENVSGEKSADAQALSSLPMTKEAGDDIAFKSNSVVTAMPTQQSGVSIQDDVIAGTAPNVTTGRAPDSDAKDEVSEIMKGTSTIDHQEQIAEAQPKVSGLGMAGDVAHSDQNMTVVQSNTGPRSDTEKFSEIPDHKSADAQALATPVTTEAKFCTDPAVQSMSKGKTDVSRKMVDTLSIDQQESKPEVQPKESNLNVAADKVLNGPELADISIQSTVPKLDHKNAAEESKPSERGQQKDDVQNIETGKEAEPSEKVFDTVIKSVKSANVDWPKSQGAKKSGRASRELQALLDASPRVLSRKRRFSIEETPKPETTKPTNESGRPGKQIKIKEDETPQHNKKDKSSLPKSNKAFVDPSDLPVTRSRRTNTKTSTEKLKSGTNVMNTKIESKLEPSQTPEIETDASWRLPYRTTRATSALKATAKSMKIASPIATRAGKSNVKGKATGKNSAATPVMEDAKSAQGSFDGPCICFVAWSILGLSLWQNERDPWCCWVGLGCCLSCKLFLVKSMQAVPIWRLDS